MAADWITIVAAIGGSLTGSLITTIVGGYFVNRRVHREIESLKVDLAGRLHKSSKFHEKRLDALAEVFGELGSLHWEVGQQVACLVWAVNRDNLVWADELQEKTDALMDRLHTSNHSMHGASVFMPDALHEAVTSFMAFLMHYLAVASEVARGEESAADIVERFADSASALNVLKPAFRREMGDNLTAAEERALAQFLASGRLFSLHHPGFNDEEHA